MAHNGGRFQTQPWFLYLGGMWPFINKIKCSVYWEYAAGRPAASILNANGYPTSVAGGSLHLVVQDEGTTYRTGKRILTWTGNQTFTLSGASPDSGQSLSGSHGRCVCVMSDNTSPRNITITLTATDGNLTSMCWMHEDDEARYSSEKTSYPSREPFGTKFLQTLQDNPPGVWRFLDMQNANESNVALWAHRTPVDHFSYAVSYFPPSLYGGTLSGTNPNFTATLSGFALTDGATVIVDIPGTTVASGTTTLNVSGTGAKPIKLPGGTAWTRSSTGTDRRGTFTYSAILDAFITFNKDFDEGITGGVPPEVCIDLCNALNCHGHFVPPPMTCDTPSDYMQRFAEDAASRLNSGLQFRCEQGPNECWNGLFAGTALAGVYSTARYGVSSVNDWYGRSGATIGNLIKTAFAGDRSRYAVLCGFQTTQAPDNVSGSNTSRRIESTRHVAAGGTAASQFITHVCPANYWTTMRCFADTVGTSNERYLRMVAFVDKAREWDAGDAATKLAAIDWVFGGTSVDDWITSEISTRLDRWSAVAQSYNVYGTSQKLGITFYEGNYYPGDIASDPTHGIDGVTLGNPTVITINQINSTQAHCFRAGMAARFRGIGGTTQLNGNTYTVLSVTATTVTIDVDSTGFGTFTSGGSGTFGYGSSLTNGIIYNGFGNTGNQTAQKFQNASKASTGSLFAVQKVFAKIMTYSGAEFPADYLFVGPSNQWSKFSDLYSTPSPQWDAMRLFNRRLKRKRLTVTV